MKQLLDARDLLLNAHAQHETSISALRGALGIARSALCENYDAEAARQIEALHTIIASLPRVTTEMIDAIAETLEALAAEVTVHEEHLPAGMS